MAKIVRPSSRFERADRALLEALESRIVLSAVDGLPDVSDLETSTNPVVVLETSFGDIYIELFEQDAPLSVANFIEYVERGQYSESFFHRSQAGFVLQGGGFAFNDDLGLQSVFDPELDSVVNEFGRPNVERTIAYARTADPDSATSQFFFNLDDNTSILDPQLFTVFGRVITEDSWDAVQSIVALDVEDLRGDDSFQDQLVDRFGAPLFRDADGFLTLDDTGTDAFGNSAMGSNGFSLGGFPVRASFDGDFDDGDEVEIINAQVVKPAGSNFFFDQVVTFPEGFRTNRSADVVELVNPNGAPADVQVVIRYENGLRDRTVFSGTLDADSTRTIVLHDALNGATPLVRSFAPFAVEVYTATAPGGVDAGAAEANSPVGATLRHTDFGGVAGEAFENVSETGSRSQMFEFSNVPVGAGVESFLVWQNLGDAETEVTVSFIGDTFTPFNRNFDLAAYRRGGFELSSDNILSGLPAGTIVGVRITANTEIVAALSSYQTSSGRPADDGEARMSLGSAADGLIEGVIPGAFIPSTGSARLTALNANNSAAVIQLIARTASGQQFSSTPVPFIMTAQSRASVDLATIFPLIPRGEAFSIAYVSTTPVTLDFEGDGSFGLIEDTIAAAVQTRAGSIAHFAGALLDTDTSGTGGDVLSIFNPFAGETISLEIEFRFSDGTLIILDTQTLGARENVNISLSELTQVANKAASGTEFSTFGITIRGFDEFGLDPRQLVAQITRTDTRELGDRGEALSLLPTLDGTVLFLDDPVFDGGTPS